MVVIDITNQKGGVAKTTTAAALSSALARKGYRVLAIDMDPQCSLTSNCNGTPSDEGIYGVLTNANTIFDGIQHCEKFDLLPSSPRMKMVELVTSTEIGREMRLRDALRSGGNGVDEVEDEYDFVIIDTPPVSSYINVSALVAADYCIIPTVADENSLAGISQIWSNIQNIRRYRFNPDLKVLGILLTCWNPRLKLSKKIESDASKMAQIMGTQVFPVSIRNCVSTAESKSTDMKDLFDYDETCTSAQDYLTFSSMVLEGVKASA